MEPRRRPHLLPPPPDQGVIDHDDDRLPGRDQRRHLSVIPSPDQAVADRIMSRGPVDVSPLHKQVTGYIVSEGPSDPLNLGVAGELYPALRWRSGIKACQLEDDSWSSNLEETTTVQLAPGLRFDIRDLAIYGGLNPSPADVTASRPAGWEQGDWAARQVATGDQIHTGAMLETCGSAGKGVPSR
jgi:hypothetical protein